MNSNEIKEPTEDEWEAMSQEEVLDLCKKIGLKPVERHPEKSDLVKMLKVWFANRDFTPDPEWEITPDPEEVREAIEDPVTVMEKEYLEEKRRKEIEEERERWKADLTDEEFKWWADPLRIGGNSPLGKGVDFITYYKNYMDGLTDANDMYKEAAALFLISTLARWNFAIWEHNNLSGIDSVETIPLNIWFILLGKSRIARKSTIIKPVKNLIWKITEKRTVTRNYGKTKRTKDVCALLPNMFTPEALISTLYDRCWDRQTSKGGYIGKKTHACWINDEVSSFFVKLSKQDYMGGTAEALSNLYDCPKLYFHETMKRGEEIVENPYLTLLLASTLTLPKLFSSHQIEQGFLNRAMYIFDYKRPFERKQVFESGERWSRIEEWLEALYECKPDRQVFLILLNNDFMKFDKKIFQYIAKEDLGILEGYYSQLPILLQKLAGLYCISRMGLEDFHHINLGTINKFIPDDEKSRMTVWNWRWISDEDYQRAYNFLKKVISNFKKMVQISMVKISDRPIDVLDNSAIMVYRAIFEAYSINKKPVTQSELYAKLKHRLKRDTIYFSLDSLAETRNIEVFEVQTGGRPKRTYKPVKSPKIDVF